MAANPSLGLIASPSSCQCDTKSTTNEEENETERINMKPSTQVISIEHLIEKSCSNYKQVQTTMKHETLFPKAKAKAKAKATNGQRNKPPTMLNALNFLLIVKCLLTVTLLAAAQCPWTRESAELHSDCICDFNPSQTTNFEHEHPINRMSVQCSPVNFEQLLKALKQSAAIELPSQQANEDVQLAALQFATQAKLDLLHISNSTIKQLLDDTFMVDLNTFDNRPSVANNTLPDVSLELSATTTRPKSGQLVVAIQSLHLSRCGIEQIQAQAFNGLEWSLTSLSLSDNQLETIPVTPLRRLINLKVLDLSNNKLLHVKANSFATLNKLNTLRLADNSRLGQQPSTATSVASMLMFANKQRPNNTSAGQAIDLQAFVGLEASLTDLNLKNTQLATFPAAIKTLRKLAFLNLAQNQISHIPTRSFEFMSSLTAINLERNRISHIDNNTFLGVESSLSSLSLLGNLLEEFPADQLAKLSALRRLDMGFNRIETLPNNAFASNKRLILIALDGNPLETLPEAAFKPLEGTLRGMSIGGKGLNCDCRLSWMLRWQQEFNMQISSREREPQFCAQPHYLRSLVSFTALKPEHLTCSGSTILGNVASQTFSGSTHQPIQPAYVIPKSNLSSSWSEAQPSSYFTLPAQFNTEPLFTAARLATPFWTTLAAAYQNSQTATTTGSPPTTTPATRSPTTTRDLPAGSEAERGVETTSQASNSVQRGSRGPHTGFTEYFSTTDLTEAGTNDEPTLRSDQTATSTELNNIEPAQGLKTTVYKPENEPTTSMLGVVSLYGDRTVPVSNQSDLSLQTGHNNLASLPDDELFATNQPSRKTNRHGYLASPGQRLKTSATLDEILRSSSGSSSSTLSLAKQTEHQQRSTSHNSLSSKRPQLFNPTSDLMRRNNSRTTTSSIASVELPASSTPEPISQASPVDPGFRLRPIQSVFGSRAGENTSQSQKRQPSSLLQPKSTSTSIPLVAATLSNTSNAYKHPQHMVYSNQSSSTSSTGPSSLLKGARFVDDTFPARSWSRSTNQPTLNLTNSTPLRAVEPQLVESDIERYQIASSNVQTRVSGGSQLQQARVVKKPSKAPKDSGWDTTTTVLASTSSNEPQFQAPLTNTTTAQPMRPFANNTRMSVSSMYRLATSSPKLQTSSISSTPAPVSISAASSSHLEAAAESESEKITRNLAQPETTLPNLLEATLRLAGQLATTRSLSESRRQTFSPNTTTDLAPKTSWTQPILSTSLQTTKPPQVAEMQTQNSSLQANEPGTTTRMAATVRFVDSSPPLVRLSTSPSVSTNFFNSTSVSSTTTRPTLIVVVQNQDKPSSAHQNFSQMSHARQSSNSSILIESALQTGELAKLKTPTQQPKQTTPVELVVTTANFQTQQATKRPQQNVVAGEQQHEARLTLSFSSNTTRRPILQAVGSASPDQEPATSATTVNYESIARPVSQRDIITKDNFSHHQRQGRDESNSFSLSGSSQKFFGKLVKLADFDQLALILAGLLCLFILVLALTIVCICYSSWKAGKERHKTMISSSSRLSSFSSDHNSPANQKSAHNSHSQYQGKAGGWLSWILCGCCCPGDSSNKRITPMRSLILQDDDNSSGSGSSDSNGLKTTGKSMLLTANANSSFGRDLLFGSLKKAPGVNAGSQQQLVCGRDQTNVTGTRKGAKTNSEKRRRSYEDNNCIFTASKPLDHQAGIQTHRINHALDQEYFVGVSPAVTGSGKTIARRGSMVAPSSSRDLIANMTGRELDMSHDGDDEAGPNNTANNNDWIRDDTLSSCDSDKSCSPGANRNNRYNISEAHRAHMRSKNGSQIEASMFVTTSSSGLLRTIEDEALNMPADHFDRMSRMSSDKSTTDDSRTPLSNSRAIQRANGRILQPHQQPSTLRSATTRTFTTPQVTRSKSINRTQPTLKQALTPIGPDPISPDYLNPDLFPLSTENDWPEPYNEPIEEEQMNQQQSSSFGNFCTDGQQQFVQYRPDHFHQATFGRSQIAPLASSSQRRHVRGTHKRATSGAQQGLTCYDDAYLTNWHTMSRSKQGGHSTATNEALIRNHPDVTNNQSTLIKYRSIPSLSGFPQHDNLQQQHQSNNLLQYQFGGATNWLRWTPTSFVNQRNLNDDNRGSHRQLKKIDDLNGGCFETNKSRAHQQPQANATKGWHRDNHIEAVYVTANQQR